MKFSFRHMAMKMVFLSLFILHFSLSHAQHYIGPAIGGGFVQSIDPMPQTGVRLSGGGEIGLAYQYQHEHFLLSTGLNYSLQCPTLSVDSQWLEQKMIDTRGMPFTYRGLLSERTDRLHISQITVPLMVGGVWRGVYILGGAKLCVTLDASARQSAALWTAGDYNGRYYEWFEDMPNHGYHDFEPVESKHAMTLNRLDVRLAAELGYTFRLHPYSGNRLSPLLRIGLFAEYGFLNILPSSPSTDPRTTTDWTQYLNVDMTHIYASKEAADARANMLACGIRLSLLFPVSKDALKRYKCQCLYYGR